MLTVLMLTTAWTLAAAPPQAPAPAPATPSECVRAVEDFRAKRQKEAPRPLTSEIMRAIDADRIAKAKECAARFDAKTVPQGELASLVQLYSLASQPELGKSVIDRGLETLAPAARAGFLPTAISTILRTEPKSDERNARLEKLVDELDTLSEATLEQKFAAHGSLNGYYRGDDIDAGILKHSNWMMNAAKTMTPEQRKQFGPQTVSAYRNAAQALAGQGKNDEALALLRQAQKDLADVPNVSRSVEPEIARYMLVGTPAAPVKAPVWLNAPEGTAEMPMTGHVTLLEFTAHWCGPCRESYPGINRLREKYGTQGFRVVLATQLYGHFKSERELDARAEIERDRAYFQEHHMDVPVAVGDKAPPAVRNADGTLTFTRDANDENYKVGGIPQIHLIDKQGRIRLIMVGYDDANEEKLGSMIQSLLAEKPGGSAH